MEEPGDVAERLSEYFEELFYVRWEAEYKELEILEVEQRQNDEMDGVGTD